MKFNKKLMKTNKMDQNNINIHVNTNLHRHINIFADTHTCCIQAQYYKVYYLLWG